MNQRWAQKYFLSFLCIPLLVGTLTAAPAVAEEPPPTESISATPSPDPSESASPSTEVSTPPTAEPTSTPSVSPEPSSSPSPSLSPEPSDPIINPDTSLETNVQDEFSLIVTFERNTSEAKQDYIVESIDSVSLSAVSDITGSTSVIVATGDIESAIKELDQTPGVKAVSEDKIKTFASSPNDPGYSQQWYLKPWQPGSSYYGINAEAAWDKTQGSEEAIVAVLDTGKIDHPDLVGKWLPGWDFVDNNSDPTDPGLTPGDTDSSGWHGTAIAGVIAGATNNGVGIAGVNWNTKILPVRVGSGDGASDSNLIKGIRWAAGLPVAGAPTNQNPAKIINISWGGEDICSTAYQDAINAVEAAGSLVVVAAGNGDSNGNNENANRFSPANCQKVLTVSASSEFGMKTTWANYGDVVDVMAPGEHIYTTTCSYYNSCNGYYNYETVSGTSFAAPIAAAVASLALSINPSFTPAELESLIKSSANQRSNYTCAGGCGTGVIDAYQVVNSINGIWNTSDAELIATLPLNDGFQDQVTLQFDSTSSSAATLTLLNDQGDPTSVVDWIVTPVQGQALSFRGTSIVSLDGLVAGSYFIRISQDQNTLNVPLLIGTGILDSISITKSSNTVYPYRDDYKDSATITVTGRDAQGNIIPIRGGVTLNKISVPLTLTENTATWNWASIPKGTKEIVASGIGPASGPTKSMKATIVVGASVATKATVTTNSSTVYPVKDNYLDRSSITVSLTTNTGIGVPGSGTVWIYKGAKKIKGWTFTKANINSAGKMVLTWDGRASGKISKGTYSIRVSFKSNENGKTITASKNLVVSDKKRVLKTKKGPWYSAKAAINECKSGYFSGCSYSGNAVIYEAYDWVESEHRLPLPVTGSSVHSWRLKVDGISSSIDYFSLFICDDYYCDSYGDEQTFNGQSNENYVWTSPYTSRGMSDGHADWALDGEDGWSFTVYRYQIEVRYWALV